MCSFKNYFKTGDTEYIICDVSTSMFSIYSPFPFFLFFLSSHSLLSLALQSGMTHQYCCGALQEVLL